MANLNSSEMDSLETHLEEHLPLQVLRKVWAVTYGTEYPPNELFVSKSTMESAAASQIQLKTFQFTAAEEQLHGVGDPRIVRVGLFQNQLPLPPDTPIEEQRVALYKLAEKAITLAAVCGVNIFCFQEGWALPFAFTTQEGLPCSEYAEFAENGPTTLFLRSLAKTHNMVIINTILEKDSTTTDMTWNTAVVLSNSGQVIGKSRQNRISQVDDNNIIETTFNHPVFDTQFGKIAINIGYGGHHPLNWTMFGLNGAEIVFNPSAMMGALSEPLWPLEARNAAVANHYFTCAVNRVGTKVLPNVLTTQGDTGNFYGSSYVAGPDGSRSPGLSRLKDGLLVVEMDLNQINDKRNFGMTMNLPLCAASFVKASQPDYKPHVIKEEERSTDK